MPSLHYPDGGGECSGGFIQAWEDGGDFFSCGHVTDVKSQNFWHSYALPNKIPGESGTQELACLGQLYSTATARMQLPRVLMRLCLPQVTTKGPKSCQVTLNSLFSANYTALNELPCPELCKTLSKLQLVYILVYNTQTEAQKYRNSIFLKQQNTDCLICGYLLSKSSLRWSTELSFGFKLFRVQF